MKQRARMIARHQHGLGHLAGRGAMAAWLNLRGRALELHTFTPGCADTHTMELDFGASQALLALDGRAVLAVVSEEIGDDPVIVSIDLDSGEGEVLSVLDGPPRALAAFGGQVAVIEGLGARGREGHLRAYASGRPTTRPMGDLDLGPNAKLDWTESGLLIWNGASQLWLWNPEQPSAEPLCTLSPEDSQAVGHARSVHAASDGRVFLNGAGGGFECCCLAAGQARVGRRARHALLPGASTDILIDDAPPGSDDGHAPVLASPSRTPQLDSPRSTALVGLEERRLRGATATTTHLVIALSPRTSDPLAGALAPFDVFEVAL